MAQLTRRLFAVLALLFFVVVGKVIASTAVASALTVSEQAASSGLAVGSVLETRVGVVRPAVPTFVGSQRPGNPIAVGETCPRFDGIVSGSRVATNAGPDFVAGPIGSQPPVPVSQGRMAAGFNEMGFPSAPTASPGTSYTLPDGSKVRLMEPTVQAPRRASFTNANDGYINPFTGKPVQPPAPPGVSMKEWVRLNTHVEQTP